MNAHHLLPLPLLLLLLSPALSQPHFLTGETGHLVGTNQHSQSATHSGPLFLQDVYALEKLRRFNTERIPERVVHPRGAAAHGIFRTYVSLANLTSANFLSDIDVITDVTVRFSTVIHGRGSPETLRDPRGFAVKFKTNTEGNWDLVGNNLPVFFIRDHIKFPDLVHSLKPDPVTNIQDPNRFFDFFAALGGMATHMLTYLYSDLGVPAGYRHMDGNSVHAYKMVNDMGVVTYVKFRWFSMQGVRNLTMEEAAEVQGKDFNHATRDLYDAIRRGDMPEWELAIQTMKVEELNHFDFDPLDSTKEWPEHRFPFVRIGKMTLNRIPENFHLTSEQVAFDPGNFLPGAIEPSEDRLLQGRLISYHESQTHRHGSNLFQRLPVNLAKSGVRTYGQEGVMVHEHDWKGSVNYEPNHDREGFMENKQYLYSTRNSCGQYRQESIPKTLNFRQAGMLYRRFSTVDRDNLVRNIAADLGQVTNMKIRNTMCAHFYKADLTFGGSVAGTVECDMMQVKLIAADLQE